MSEKEDRREAEKQARHDMIREVVEKTLQEFKDGQMNLQSEGARWSIAYKITDNLCRELDPVIDDLDDQVDSLWFMLDEMKASDTSKNKELFAEINKSVNLQLVKLRMMMNQKGEA
jgi:Mg2+ and Co2+ transporter CorA